MIGNTNHGAIPHDIANKPYTTSNGMSTVTLLITHIMSIAL